MQTDLNRRIRVHKLDAEGIELWQYEGIVLERNDTYLTLEAFFNRDAVEIAGLQLRRGDRFVETFYFERWYNIFAIHDKETEQLKGWYCNICRPAWMESQDLFAEDLALDIIVLPDRQIVVVDQDEFEALNLSTLDRAKAQAALEELTKLARAADAPFLDGNLA